MTHQSNDIAMRKRKLCLNGVEARPILPSHHDDTIDFGSRQFLRVASHVRILLHEFAEQSQASERRSSTQKRLGRGQRRHEPSHRVKKLQPRVANVAGYEIAKPYHRSLPLAAILKFVGLEITTLNK